MASELEAELGYLQRAGVLELLLRDKTTGRNIIWGTDTYAALGEDYGADREIGLAQVLRPGVLKRRAQKADAVQSARTKRHAEVFTPLAVATQMIAAIDSVWWQRKSDGFALAGESAKVLFSQRRTWQQYVDSRRLEITCGEAPYLTQRYDTATGEAVALSARQGILDRKLRVVAENTDSLAEWRRWARRAIEASYGYEFQGDSLLIARLNVLLAYVDSYRAKWGSEPETAELRGLANVVGWNVWQMNGLTGCVPYAPTDTTEQLPLWGDSEAIRTRCRIYDWRRQNSLDYSAVNTGGRNMKFKYVIGNPPYQEDDGGAQASAKPVYNAFVDGAKEVSNKCVCLIIPARWYAGGKGLDQFRKEMLEDKHIKTLHDFPNTEDCFYGVNIRGGVCYFLRDENYCNTNEFTKVYTHNGNKVNVIKRNLKTEGIDIFLRYSESVTILSKITDSDGIEFFDSYISARKPFGLSTDFMRTACFHLSSDDLKRPVPCYGKNKKIGYVEYEKIPSHAEWVGKWKVFTSRANNIGTELNDDNLNTFIGKDEICTESYIVIGADKDLQEIEARNIATYLTTKFARFCHSLAKSSQDATAKTYKYVPLQDFTASSDIDWSKSIPKIDRQLYKKYGLSPAEIDFIESHVKEMA